MKILERQVLSRRWSSEPATAAMQSSCDNYRRFARKLKRSMRQIHRAGEKLFIDFAGPTMALSDGSRASTFAALDAPALLPLPLQRHEMAHFKTVKTHIDYHVEVERHRDSVPHALVSQVLEARITTSVVETLHRGQRVASHARNSRHGGFTTVSAHMPAAHRAHMEWTPQRLIHWGQSIGPATAVAVTRLMEENKHPEHGYRACLGLLSLAKRCGKPRLEAGCTLALQTGACKYRHVRDILANNRDQSTPTTAGDWNPRK